jgi:NosR/NirI family transcriptional regulator, nitrous oxide reductase regulator
MSRGIRRLLVFAALVAAALVGSRLFAATLPSASDLLAVVPGAASFEHEIRPLDFYRLKDAAGRDVGVAFVTSQIPPQVAGYGGEIDVLVGMDASQRITGAKILGQHEAPQYIQRVFDAGFLSRFIGKKAGENFKDIETVSGATISSRAIIEDARTAAAAMAAGLAGAKVLAEAGERAVPWVPIAAVVLLVALSMTAMLRHRVRWLRTATLVLSVAVIGFWLNAPVTIGDLVDLRNLSFGWTANAPLAILIVFAVVAGLVRGNLYCASLCPFGALQEGCARLTPHKCAPGKRALATASYLRWIVAIVAIAAIADATSSAFRTVEPFALCFLWPPEKSALLQAGVVLAAALIVRRAWCRFFCPTGLVFDLVALLGAKARHAVKGIGRRKQVRT